MIPIAVERITFDGKVSGQQIITAFKAVAGKHFFALNYSRNGQDLLIFGYNSVHPRDDAVVCLDDDGTNILIDPERVYDAIYVSSTYWNRDNKRRTSHSHDEAIASIRDLASSVVLELERKQWWKK